MMPFRQLRAWETSVLEEDKVSIALICMESATILELTWMIQESCPFLTSNRSLLNRTLDLEAVLDSDLRAQSHLLPSSLKAVSLHKI
jgi:hypothetical protein